MGSGISGQFNVGTETVVGTAVAASQSYRHTSESLNFNVHDYQSQAIGGALVLASGERVITYTDGSGGLVLDTPTKGFGRVLKQALGSGATSTPVAQSSPTALLQTHVVQAAGTSSAATDWQNGKSLTIQKLVADDTAPQPFTFGGCKVTSIEFSCQIGGGLVCTLGFDAMNVRAPTGATGVYAAQGGSYISGTAIHHFGSYQTFALGGSVITNSGIAAHTSGTAITSLIKGFSVKLDWGLATDRVSVIPVGGVAINKKEQVVNARPTITGTLTGEFTNSVDIFDKFVAGTSMPLNVIFRTGPAIASTFYHEIRFLLPAIQLTGDTPNNAGYDIVELDSPFLATYDGVNTPLQVQYQSTDAAL
jgi:hypothetical protein